MTQDIEKNIVDEYASFTKSEKIVATYILENIAGLPFENLSTIAANCNVSDMTVSRFIRSLGFKNINAFKSALRANATAPRDDLDDISKRKIAYFTDKAGLKASLDKEVQNLCDVYALSQTDVWQEVVQLVAYKANVLVIGFQAVSGVAQDFSTSLKYIRHGTRYLDDPSGLFLDLFELPAEDTCLVMVDTARYSAVGRKLIARASKAGIATVFISDKFGSWGFDHTRFLLRASSNAETFWDSRVGISAIANLLQHFVANELNASPRDRQTTANELADTFGAFED